MSKICLIKQPAGIGDIFFAQKIAKKIKEKHDCRIIWPVIKQFDYIKDYMDSDIEYPTEEEDFPFKYLYENNHSNIISNDELIYLPLFKAGEHFRGTGISPVMAKYKLVNLEYNDWSSYFNFKRNKEREDYLFYDVLKIKDDEKYNFVNSNFASPPDVQKIDNIKIDNDYRTVEMKFFDFDNLFDWCKVLENATEIHTIQTSIQYMMEVMILKAKKKVIYQRPNWGNNFDYIEGLFEAHDWEYIT